MSRRTSSREQVAKKPSITRSSREQVGKKPSITRSQASAKGSTVSTKSGAKTSTPAVVEKKEYDLPALSVYKPPKLTESALEKLKRKTIRRNAPPGENLKQIKDILRNIKGQNIPVQEFIFLIGPSTGDGGQALREVMQEDLNNFRKLARKVYDTITQDNSDVIHNQQLQLSEYYKEKKALLHDKMMRYIDEIYMMAPNFCMDRYAAEGDKYLSDLFPLPQELVVEPEEMEMMKRQAAYHRLQWLRSEGERLNEENNSLKKRLNHLKQMHQHEKVRMMEMEKAAEAKKQQLEAQQAAKVETLDMLNESLEKTIIDKEKSIRKGKDRIVAEKVPSKKQLVKKKSKGAVKKRPPWNQEAAREIEERALQKGEAADKLNATRSTSPFHFSPIKTPPQRGAAPKERSPFHYSPPPSPPGARYSQPPRSVPEPPQKEVRQPQRMGRRAQAPRDSWGGY